MNIKVRVSQGLQGEFNNKLGAIYEQEVQRRVDVALEGVVEELVEVVGQEIEEMEAKYNKDLMFLSNLASLAEELAGTVIKNQAGDIEELEATLEEAEAKIDRLAADKRDLMNRIHELEMENQELIRHIQMEEEKALYAKVEAMEKEVAAAKKAETKKAAPKCEEINEDELDILELFTLIASAVEDGEDK